MSEQDDQPNAGDNAETRSDRNQQRRAMTAADQPPDAGKRPPQAESPSGTGGAGTGGGYSGQEYDSEEQKAWRAEQEQHALDPSGEVHGSGAGAGGGNDGEDYDSDSAAGSGQPPTGAGSRE